MGCQVQVKVSVQSDRVVFVSTVTGARKMRLMFSNRNGVGIGWTWVLDMNHPRRKRYVEIDSDLAVFVAAVPKAHVVHEGALRLIHSDLRPHLLLARLFPTPIGIHDTFDLSVVTDSAYEVKFANGDQGAAHWTNCTRLDPYLVARHGNASWSWPKARGSMPSITVLGLDTADADLVEDWVRKALTQLVPVLGPLPYRRLLVDLGLPRLGGMEHPEAIRATIGSIGHELVHQWFGTFFRAPGEDALWFDEAVATLLTEESLPNPKKAVNGLRLDDTTVTPRLAYGYGAFALSRAANVKSFLMEILKDPAKYRLPKEVEPWVGTRVVATHGSDGPELELDAPTANPNQVIERGISIHKEELHKEEGKGEKISGSGGGGQAEIWDGLIFVRAPADTYPKAVAYRTPMVSGTAKEFWAMRDGFRFNPENSGYIDWRCITPSGTDPDIEDLADFKSWLEGYGFTATELFEHTVTYQAP